MKNAKIMVADYKAFAKDFTTSKCDSAAWKGLRHVRLTPAASDS